MNKTIYVVVALFDDYKFGYIERICDTRQQAESIARELNEPRDPWTSYVVEEYSPTKVHNE
jgi:hypothetical protein